MTIAGNGTGKNGGGICASNTASPNHQAIGIIIWNNMHILSHLVQEIGDWFYNQEIREKITHENLVGIQEQMVLLAKKLEITPHCIDAEGNELKIGDYVSIGADIPIGGFKKVLAIGIKAACFTKVNEEINSDGWWHEATLIQRGWKRIIPKG